MDAILTRIYIQLEHRSAHVLLYHAARRQKILGTFAALFAEELERGSRNLPQTHTHKSLTGPQTAQYLSK